MANSETHPRKRLRLPRRFSLRLLLCAVTIVAVWLGVQGHHARVERQAHEAVAALARSIQYDFQYEGSGDYLPDAESGAPVWLRELVGEEFFRRIHTIHFSPQTTDADLARIRDRLESLRGLRQIYLATSREVSDEGLAQLRDLHRLESLDLRSTSVSNAGLSILTELPNLEELQLGEMGRAPSRVDDDGLRHVAGMGALRSLFLFGGSFTDAGLEHLEGSTELRLLWLDRTGVSDAGLASLEKLQNLEVLALQFCEITNAGVASLRSFPHLKRLYMTGTKVSDEGLTQLANLRELERLSVTRTQVTPQGLAGFQAILPNCDVK